MPRNPLPATADPARIEAVRRFNRFYTRQIGTLKEGLLDTAFSLTEARILYEIAHRDLPSATAIASDLGLDLGYLSRVLRGFSSAGLLLRRPSPTDRRQSLLSLTAKGRTQAARLARLSQQEVATTLSPLPESTQQQLVAAMDRIESILSPRPANDAPYLLRPHRPGDIGWIIQRHGSLYAQEYGWDLTFEALVARIAADFLDHFLPQQEACWIADRSGERLGSVLLVKEREALRTPTARLRLLLVDPAARGLGLGRALVQQCHSFARTAGYKRIVLWTNGGLDAARHIYESEGYRLVSEKPHTSFGKKLIGQNWRLDL